MSKETEHAAECNAQWRSQYRTNDRHDSNIETLFNRVRDLEIRVAVLAAVGGVIGGFIGKLLG